MVGIALSIFNRKRMSSDRLPSISYLNKYIVLTCDMRTGNIIHNSSEVVVLNDDDNIIENKDI